jgi:hypothetical protein
VEVEDDDGGEKDNRKREKELSHKIIQCGKFIMVYHDTMANTIFPSWDT